jgi:hypothetical protein
MSIGLINKEDITVTRSPARVSWWVVYNNKVLGTRDTKRQAESLRDDLLKEYSSG